MDTKYILTTNQKLYLKRIYKRKNEEIKMYCDDNIIHIEA